MTNMEYRSVVDNMRLPNNMIWTLPITMDIAENVYNKINGYGSLYLYYKNEYIEFIDASDYYKVDVSSDLEKVYGTKNLNHPGVIREIKRSPYRIGGKVIVENESFLKNVLKPEKTRKIFTEYGWKTIVGFQTRNPIHRAHEYLQRQSLEICDGLFINPSMGWKKKGDFTEIAINKAYEIMIKKFYPSKRVYFEGYKTYFRYAGPREAIFHAILRRNLGCTHFIIGRDHAGVGDFYGHYEAQHFARKILESGSLGIKLLFTRNPYFCKVCRQIVNDRHCKHRGKNIIKISGTDIRADLKVNKIPSEHLMRPEISKELIKLNDGLFTK